VTVKLNYKGFRELRRSPAVKADLLRRGQRIAEAAGPGYIAQESPGRNRARVVIIPDTYEAAVDSLQNLTLIRVMDAGRG